MLTVSQRRWINHHLVIGLIELLKQMAERHLRSRWLGADTAISGPMNTMSRLPLYVIVLSYFGHVTESAMFLCIPDVSEQ